MTAATPDGCGLASAAPGGPRPHATARSVLGSWLFVGCEESGEVHPLHPKVLLSRKITHVVSMVSLKHQLPWLAGTSGDGGEEVVGGFEHMHVEVEDSEPELARHFPAISAFISRAKQKVRVPP